MSTFSMSRTAAAGRSMPYGMSRGWSTYVCGGDRGDGLGNVSCIRHALRASPTIPQSKKARESPKIPFFHENRSLLRLRLVGLQPALSGVKNMLTPRVSRHLRERGGAGCGPPFSWRRIRMYGAALTRHSVPTSAESGMMMSMDGSMLITGKILMPHVRSRGDEEQRRRPQGRESRCAFPASVYGARKAAEA